MDVKGFLKKCLRVLKIARKPDKTEFTTSAKITGLGILAIGTLGFIIYLIANLRGIF